MDENIELGPGPEFDLIGQIRARLGVAHEQGADSVDPRGPERTIAVGIGDDAAVTEPGGVTATSVDALVEGVHFDRASSPPAAIGHKALASALSDLAAMGAIAGEAYVVLGVPESYEPEATLEICDGLAALAVASGTRLIGGDLTRATELFLAVTVVGHAGSAADLVTRAGAMEGSSVVVTGELGGAAAGRLLLADPELVQALGSAAEADALRERQLRPNPQLAAGLALRGAGAEAMIDLSDGLGSDAAHLSSAGGVGLRIELKQVPIQSGVEEVAGVAGVDPLELATAGGEDYELLAVLAPERHAAAAAAVADAGTTLTSIGEVVPGSKVELLDADGRLREPAGYDHFKPA
jgi:thiamine-monophosphate kinase